MTDSPERIARWMRVPEAWEALQAIEPEIAAGIDAPSDLAHRLREARHTSAPAPLAWEASHAAAAEPPADFHAVLDRASALADAGARGLQAEVAQAVTARPDGWRSALAIAWPEIAGRDVLARELACARGPLGASILANAMLAAESTVQAASSLHQLLGEQAERALENLCRAGFVDLARTLADRVPPPTPGRPDPRAGLAASARALSFGDLAAARQALVEGWERALDLSAEHGDRLADAALADGDSVSAIEAVKQAFAHKPSPERKARLALLLAGCGRAQEARAWINPDPVGPQECIAASMVAIALEETAQAALLLRRAVSQAEKDSTLGRDWLEALAGALETTGQSPEAALVVGRLLHWNPADASLRIRVAEALLSAGDPATAVGHARTAVGLQPESAQARRLLARCLRAVGKSDEALQEWQQLPTPVDEDSLETARCAIEAGQHDVATHVAESLITSKGASAASLGILGRALMAAGRLDEARQRLEAACAVDPRDPESWTALADCQAALGDPHAVGLTLAAAAQAAPDSAPVQHALAVWLRAEGRTSEALQAAAKAAADPNATPEFALEHGELLVELGHDEQAVDVLRALLAKRPGSWPVRRALAQAFLRLGNIAEAAELVAHIPDRADASARAFAGQILIAQATSTHDIEAARKAMKLFESALEHGPAPEVQVGLARALEVLDQTDEALEHFRSSIDQPSGLSPETFRMASLGLARCALRLNRVPLAVHALETAANRHGASAEVQIALSAAYAAGGQHRRALETAQRAAELSPDEAALRQLTSAASQAGECGLALHAVQRLAALQPTSPHVWLTLSEICTQSQDEPQARAALARALRLSHTDAGAWSRASDLLSRFGRTDSAERALRKALYAAPHDAGLVRKLAELSTASGDVVTAQRAWMRYADLRSDRPEGLEQAARALWLLGQRAVAIGLWQRAVALAPDHLDAHLDLARGYLTEGDSIRALEHYRIVCQSRAEDLGLILEAAAAELHYGALTGAIDLYEVATTLAPRDAAARVALGESLLMSGRAGAARQALEAARELDPTNVHVLATMVLAALGTEDASTAAVSYASAQRQVCRTAAAAAALARASIALGKWDDAVRGLDQINGTSPSLASLRASIEIRLRLADARWMYQAAGATRHAPPAEPLDEPAHALQALLGRLAELAPAWEVDRFRQRVAVCLDQADPTPLAQLAGRDPWGETVEGLAIAWLRAGRAAEALQLLTQETPGGSGRWHALLAGVAHAGLGSLDQARHSYDLAASDPALRPLADYLTAQSYLRQADEQAYTEHANRALLQWSEEPAWHFELAQVYLKNGQPDAALPHLTQAVDLAADMPEYALALARTAMDAGDLTAARAGYARVVETMPSDGTAWKEAGLCALAAGDAASAVEWLAHARPLLPGDVECLVASARACLAAGDTRQAHEHAQSAYHLAPEGAEVLLVLGEVMAHQGKLDKALQAFDRALKRTDEPLAIQIARGRLLVQIGRGEQAIEVLKTALAHEPESDTGWAALAGFLEAEGDLNEAMDAAARAVQHAPDRLAHRITLGRLCRKTGQLDRALDELLRAQAAGRSEAQVHFELGRVYEERREFKRSLDAFQRAIEGDPSNGEAHFRAGLVLKQIKAYPQAGKMLKRAVELNPRDPEVLHQLAAVRALELVHGGIPHQAVAQ